MSKDILEIIDRDGRVLVVTSYCGKNDDKSIQLTILGKTFQYVKLPSKDVKKLVAVLLDRLGLK